MKRENQPATGEVPSVAAVYDRRGEATRLRFPSAVIDRRYNGRTCFVMRHLILFLGLCCLLLGGARAAETLDRSTSGEGVRVNLTCPFTMLPPGGYVPFRVTIRNEAGTPGTWTVTFQGTANNSSDRASVYRQYLHVAGNASGTFDLLVPVPMAAISSGSNSSLDVGVAGPGFENASLNNRYFAYYYQNSGAVRSPFTLIGKDVLGSIGLGPLETLYKDQSKEFYGSVVDGRNLPTDWRGYSGAAAVLLRDSEWLALTAAQHDALCGYIAQGGHLTILTTEDLELITPQLHLPQLDSPGAYGFGLLTLSGPTVFPPSAESLRRILETAPAESAARVDEHFSVWDLRKLVGTISINSFFILLFVLVFGSLVGPVNLFVFARGKKRFRLFWTTPLISILASLALVTGILLTDGVGGTGRQMIAVLSLPGENREAIVQEQVARTAVLFSNRWSNEQNYIIMPVSDQSLKGALMHHGTYVYRNSHNDLGGSPDSYLQVGNELSGNWFRSRAISGQYLQAILPTRSTLMVLNPQADFAQNPPVVLSSYPEVLETVYLTDKQGNNWTCSHLEPGRKQTCTSSTAFGFEHFWATACVNAGGRLQPFLASANHRPGYFYATGKIAPTEQLATLGEIRWQVTNGLYLGPWVDSPTPETGR